MSSSVEVISIPAVGAIKPSPWAKLPSPIVLDSFEDVMSEQLAREIHEKESSVLVGSKESDSKQSGSQTVAKLSATAGILDNAGVEFEEPNTDNDLILAQMLQLEMDKEYDESLRRQEDLRNRNSRVSISYDKFKSVHPVTDKEEKELNMLHAPELSSSSDSEDEFSKLKFKRGICGKGENIITKHDTLLNSRHNASKVMHFPPEFDTGDTHGIDMRIPNRVFNILKMHSHLDSKRHSRLHDKQDKSTNEMSLDPKTRLVLFKMVNADILDSIGGVISTGKEATILYAPGGKSQEILVPKECVAKVYKTTLNEFKTREKYIANDYRFKDRFKHLNPQKIVRLWAEKEMHNLIKMRKYDIPCPDVVMLKRHVLIMSFIGSDTKPAPKLKDANLNQEDLKSAYEQSIQLIKDLYNRCNLVHADFNQFNLLWHENRVWIVDVSQSVEPIHPMGLEFLLRDCTNVNKFFANRKLENILSGEDLFNWVTGMNFKGQGQAFLAQIQTYIKDKQMELNAASNQESNNPYNFDYYFEKSEQKQKKSKDGKRVDTSDEDEDDDDDDYESDD